MDNTAKGSLDNRVLVLAPTVKDATLTSAIFERASILCVCCRNLADLSQHINEGVAALLIPEDVVGELPASSVGRWLRSQPQWSDLPVLILAREGADSAAVAQAMDLFNNVTVLERPTRVSTLVSAVRSALRARERQYQIRDHLLQREDESRRKDEFLAMLAHELRNPLAPIRSSLHLLRSSERSGALADRAGEIIERQVNVMVRLVDDLMEVSRVTSGKIALRRQAIDVASMLHNAIEVSRPLIDAAAQRLSLDVATEPLMVDADPVRLGQVFTNLLNNATKYTQDGGSIVVTLQREGDMCAITVRDNGIGIEADMLPKVFDLFVQAGRAPGRGQSGLGIGLTLVKTLIALHGGDVTAHSDGAGTGSKFTVRLPLTAAVVAAAHAESKPTHSQPFLERSILVVDDNHDAADSLAMLLSVMGAEVRVAYSGADALRELMTFRPAAMLLDLGMPLMDGYEVARQVRQLPQLNGMPLIAITGWGHEEDLKRSRSAGFDHHLTKPASINVLEKLLSSIERRESDTTAARSG
ncbi:MAG TPA: ATP-binding protein [Burkholderiaceae bacterium]|nr:ATP-binding protein [Burkholderiaceae bacterium]